MSFSVLARLTSIALKQFDSVDFIWHGGETMLVPMSFYEKAVALQARFLRPGCRVFNRIQTNGTRIDDRWAEFFKEWNFGVGVSLDGPREMQDRYRLHVGGQSSYDEVIRGLDVLKKHEIPFACLTVIDEEVLRRGPDYIFDFYLRIGVKDFSFISAKPINVPGAGAHTPAFHYADPGRYTDFLCRLYDRWLEHGDDSIHVREFTTVTDRLAERTGGHCTMEGRCLGRFFIVEPNGEIAHCDLFLGDPNYDFGNIMNQTFPDITQSAAMQRLVNEDAAAKENMRSHCDAFEVCSGGCPHDRYLSVRHDPNHSTECCGMRTLISHIKARGPMKKKPARLQVVA
jgi:uncharacterized protein